MAVRKRTYVDFRSQPPIVSIGQKSGTLGADNEVTSLYVGGTGFEIYQEIANADITGTRLVSAGLEVPLDNTDADGIEITQGILADANAPAAFTIGTDPAFQFSVKLKMVDVRDHQIGVGFRKAASYVADIANATPATAQTNFATAYTDFAAIFLDDNTATNNGVHLMCANDNSDTTDDLSASVTVTENTFTTLKITVSSTGVVAFYKDGTALTQTNTAGFAFDSTDVVVPFVRISRVATNADTPPVIQTWSCGLQ